MSSISELLIVFALFLNIKMLTKSSANSKEYDLFLLFLIGMSLINIENKIGLRTASCGAPVSI
jgi:hypothetical protein